MLSAEVVPLRYVVDLLLPPPKPIVTVPTIRNLLHDTARVMAQLKYWYICTMCNSVCNQVSAYVHYVQTPSHFLIIVTS